MSEAGAGPPWAAWTDPARVPSEPMLESFRPASACLDWRLSGMYWHLRGHGAFLSDEVPHTMTNDNVVAERTADVLFTSCLEGEEQGTLGASIVVVEMGVGLGLHARLVLERFVRRCRMAGKDYAQRLIYWVTDATPQNLLDIRRAGTLDGHAERVRFGVLDALAPHHVFALETGDEVALSGVHAVFCNYLLCVLPFQLLLRTPKGWAQLHVQTMIAEQEVVRKFAGLNLAAVRRGVEQGDGGALAQLVEAWEFIYTERAFLDVDPAEVVGLERVERFCAEVLEPWQREVSPVRGSPRVLSNHGAITVVERVLPTLADGGFVLFTDYGWATLEEVAGVTHYQHFGPSCAMGLGLPFFEHVLAEQLEPVASVVRPQNALQAQLHVRMISRRPLVRTASHFRHAFDGAVLHAYQEGYANAQGAQRVQDGDRACAEYEKIIASHPALWNVLTGWAGCELHLRKNPARALELATRAVAINPTCSPRVWNEYGDALYALGRLQEAHEAFERAVAIWDRDARGWANLTWTLYDLERHDEALDAANRALKLDTRQVHHEGVLQKVRKIMEFRGHVAKAKELGRQVRER